MSYSIKVNADVSGIRKDIMALSRDIEKGISGNKKIQLFDKETRNFLEKGAQSAIKGMQKEATKLEEANLKILDALKAQSDTEEGMRKKQAELIRNKRKILEIEKDIGKTQSSAANVLGQGTKMGQFSGGFKGSVGGVGDLLTKIPGIGKILGGAMGAGGGLMSMLGGAAGAGTMALGGLAVGRGFNGLNTFDQNKGSMIGMMGRGYSREEAGRRDPRFQALGMNAEDVRGLRMQSTDNFGRAGSSPDKVLDVAKNARGMGIGADQLMGAGQGLRAQLGLSGGQKAFAKLQATLISTELDGSVGPFLETTANMLTQINEHGIGLDSAALAVMSKFGSASGMSPEMTQKIFSGLDESIKGATGENAGFMMSALTSKGIGAGSLGGAQLAMSQGLFGGDAGKLRERGNIPKGELDELQQQGIISDDSKDGVKSFQKRAGAISGAFGKVTSGMGASGKALVASKLTGIKDPLAAREAMGLLEKASKGDLSQKDKKRLSDLSKDPQTLMADRLKTIADSAAGQLDISQKFKDDMSEYLGEQLVPLAVIGNKLLANMDKSLAVMSGGKSLAETTEKRFVGGGGSQEEYKGMSESDQASLKSKLNDDFVNRMDSTKKAESKLRADGSGDIEKGRKMNGVMGAQYDKDKSEMANLEKILTAIAGYTRVSAQHAQKPKTSSVQGSGKTRSK